MYKNQADSTSIPRSLVVAHEPHSRVSEQFRTIRTNIMYSSINNAVESILFTSDIPEAGKSTVAANMAIAYGQAGKNTLLLDADLRRPTCHMTFNVTNHKGLSTAIVNDIPLDSLIKQTEFDMLDIITAGPVPPNPAELLSAPKLARLIETFESHYDMVIIDSPPVLSVTDAQLISKNTSGVILITNVEKNNRNSVKEAKELMEKTGANILGIVLNKRDLKYQHDGYQYYDQR